MKKAAETKVTRYEDGNFNIDIIETRDRFEAWISHKEYGVASHMFEVSKARDSRKGFLDLVKANLPEYERGFVEEYCD